MFTKPSNNDIINEIFNKVEEKINNNGQAKINYERFKRFIRNKMILQQIIERSKASGYEVLYGDDKLITIQPKNNNLLTDFVIKTKENYHETKEAIP